MNSYSAYIKRDLSNRKFGCKNESICRTGGTCLGCPFLKMNANKRKICTLYRLVPVINSEGEYKRVVPCLENSPPPVKRVYVVNSLAPVVATSPDEARQIYLGAHGSDVMVSTVEECEEVEYEIVT